MLEKYFKLKDSGTTVRTEIIAGITTFMTMAYILAVNPDILAMAGMDKHAVFTATALSALVATLVMALVARLPFALAPGMGLNAFFAFTVVLGMGYTWQFALTAVFLEGLIFIVLTIFNVREAIVNAIPLPLKHAISAGIGLFIAFIGLQNAGLVARHEVTMVTLGALNNPTVWIVLAALILTGVLLFLKVRGALLLGILAATLAGVVAGLIPYKGIQWVSLPPSLAPVAFKLDFTNVFSLDMLIVLFTFLFIDMFDTVGTLVGVSSKAGMMSSDGKVPRVKQALLADAVGTTVGALMGTSTVTTYVESASGVAEGGRTGLTALTVAVLFGLSLFLAPVFLMIPSFATAPALILVGAFMVSPIAKINFNDFTDLLPAFLTIIMMPLTYSIAEGIAFGVLSYVLLKLFTGQHKQLTPVTYILAAIFLLKFFV